MSRRAVRSLGQQRDGLRAAATASSVFIHAGLGGYMTSSRSIGWFWSSRIALTGLGDWPAPPDVMAVWVVWQ